MILLKLVQNIFLNYSNLFATEDKLKKYGWIKHDGVNFGVQNINDQGYSLKTQFVKIDGGENGGDWSWRVSATTKVIYFKVF